MRKILFVLIAISVFTFFGCTKKVTGDEKLVEDYIKSQGYKITFRKGVIKKYTLEKSKLYDTATYSMEWGVQTVEPDKYFGKEIIVYGFIVKNHPLQERDKYAKNGVNLCIMLSEGKVIGGFSYPSNNSKLIGGTYYSLDGKTIEEITGLSYQQWGENWVKKYGN